jgi:capsular exopolysaccharide synthesis family protein
VQIRFYVSLLRKWWWMLMLGVLLFAGPAYYLTDLQPRTYRASTTIFVNQSSAPGTVTYSDALLSLQLVQTYSRMAQQPVVLEEVTRRLPLTYTTQDLEGMVSASPLRDTQLFQISVTGQHPVIITDIANTTAEVFIEQQRAEMGAQEVNALRVAQPALVPTTPIAPSPLRNAVLAGLLGLLAFGALVWLIEYLDDTVKTPEDLSAAGLATALGVVPRQRLAKDAPNQLTTIAAPRSQISEAYRLIRTNLEFAALDRPLRAVLVTSANPGEGKSTTASNVAVVLAQAGKRVILLDADLRRPSLHRIFNSRNHTGLTTMLLRENADPDDFLQPTSVEGLVLLSSGPIPPNPAELLSSGRFSSLLQRLEEAADIVIVDSPPVLAVADPIVLASRVDGTLVVVDTQKTRAGALRQAQESLAKSGTTMLGGILNKLGKNAGSYYYYYYRGYYGDDGSDGAVQQSQPVADNVPVKRPVAKSLTRN